MQTECTRYLYVFTRYGQVFGLVGAIMVAGLLWHHAANETPLGPALLATRARLEAWVLALCAVVAWQQYAGLAFRRATPVAQAQPLWRRLMMIQLAAVSTLWGLLALFMMPADPMVRIVIVLAIALLANGALPNLSVDLPVNCAWIAPQMLALIAACALRDAPGSRMLAAILCLDLLYMAWVQRDVRRNFIERVLALLRNERLVGEVQSAQVALTASLAEQKAVFDLALVGIAEIRDGRLERCNTQLALMLGHAPGELTGIVFETLRPAGADGVAFDPAVIALANGRPFAADLPLRTRHGATLWVQLTSRPVDRADSVRGHIAVFNDIGDRLEREAATRRLAYEDALTGLPNRRLLQDRVGVALLRAQRSNAGIALLLIDLDGFKTINDVHGHEAGDRVLKIVAQRLQACVRASDTVCRLGGDEFVVLLEQPVDPVNAMQVAQKIVAAASEPIVSGHGPVAIGASIGIAMAPLSGHDVDTLLRAADEAMYRAKQAGRGTCRVHAVSAAAVHDMAPG